MTSSRSVPRLSAIPEAGPWAWWFTLMSVVCFATVGVSLAAGDYLWTGFLAVTGLVMLHELDAEIREVSRDG